MLLVLRDLTTNTCALHCCHQNPFPTAPCDPGYYCTGNADKPTQHTSPAGTFSLAGASQPSPCAPGTFNTQVGQSQCSPCLAGYYCQNSSTVEPVVCPPGHHCPEGTISPERCPAGTFSAAFGLRNVTECEPCSLAQYCQNEGMTAPHAPCAAGYFCTTGSWTATPVAQAFGDVCPAGFFCEEGTHTPQPCPVGTFYNTTGLTAEAGCLPCTERSYCATTGLAQPTGLCDAGYYCAGGAISASPFPEDATGGPCTAGAYCPVGTAAPIACPPTTFMNSTGAEACALCPARFFCDGSNPSTPQPCDRGNYCPEGTGASQPQCPAGTFSNSLLLGNVSECQECEPGKYCASSGLTTFTDACNAGYFCEGSNVNAFGGTRDMEGCPASAETPCTPGHYCLAGVSQPEPCPVGRYSPTSHNDELADCLLCAAGYHCATTGLQEPTGPCHAGFFCKRGVSSPTPHGGVETVDVGGVDTLVGGAQCPAGTFCVNGTVTPRGCPPGTYNPSLQEPEACLQCPAGYYCTANATQYSDKPCPPGHYCPHGTEYDVQFPCPPGTFSSDQQLRAEDECQTCPAGQFCGGEANLVPSGNCSAGYYCVGNASTSTPLDGVTGNICVAGEFCPAGTVVPQACKPGHYCEDSSGEPTGPCQEGYYCRQGATTATPAGQVNANGETGNVCPEGHYCEQASVTPQPCPYGTFSGNTAAISGATCLPCSPGFFCNASAIVAPSVECWAGFYCPGGDVTPTLVCPTGSFCAAGVADPVMCEPGTYQDEVGQASCKECPSGYYCVSNTTTPVPCPAGHYCTNGTKYATEFPCPSGTFSNRTHLAASSECTACAPGMYCAATGLIGETSLWIGFRLVVCLLLWCHVVHSTKRTQPVLRLLL